VVHCFGVRNTCSCVAILQDMEYLKEQCDLFFQDLEKNGPPDWLVINTHKFWHHADQLMRFGPMREWWMYAFESLNGKLGRWVKNRQYPVASCMNGVGRLKLLRSLRGLLQVVAKNRLRKRGAAARAALMAGRAPGVVVTTTGSVGKPYVLKDTEVSQLELWMRATIPVYTDLFKQYSEFKVYVQR
jgi:hypothetical protein